MNETDDTDRASLEEYRKAVDARHVRSFFDCSTAHLDACARAELDEAAAAGTDSSCKSQLGLTSSHAYGWWVYVGEAGADVALPKAFSKIFSKARRLGCEYVNFDADGPEHEDLPILHEDCADRDDYAGPAGPAEEPIEEMRP